MKYISVCSGIEAATCAWHPLGWEPFAFAEIEKFPSKVLAHHYQQVPNFGDMTKFEEWPDATIDLLVGGTPCQSFSVAGLRKGLADPRGNLMLTYGAIARRYRPKWLVWENVPGVLSSNGGRDFGTFLGMLGQLRYGFAYRVLDAQYFGVAQRRRRVFVVGCLGDWRGAAAVLFERHSLQGNPAPSREAGKGVAPCLDVRAGRSGETTFHTSGGLVQSVAHSLRGEGFDASEDGTGRGQPIVAFNSNAQVDQMRFDEHLSASLTCSQNAAVALNVSLRGRECGATAELGDEVGNCLRASGGGGDKAHVLAPVSDTLYNKGIATGDIYASTQETYPGTLLRTLRKEVGEEAFAQWGLGILDSLQQAEVLRQALHGLSVRPATFSRSWVVCCALGFPVYGSGWLLQSLREAGCERCASQGWKPSEQLARELGAYLSELSRPGAQAERFMRDLWKASEGFGVLRHALSAIQEVRRSARSKGQPIHGSEEGRRTETDKDVLSSRLQYEVPRERLLQQACATSEERDAWDGSENQERMRNGEMAVRRLTVEECEFLQGFPRGYSRITWRKKPAEDCPDGPRYKALGNSMAVPVMAWIGRRIEQVESIQEATEIAA